MQTDVEKRCTHLSCHALLGPDSSRNRLSSRGHHEYPAIFIQGQHVQGGTSKIGQAYKTGELEHWVSDDEPEEARAPKDAAFLEVVRHEL